MLHPQLAPDGEAYVVHMLGGGEVNSGAGFTPEVDTLHVACTLGLKTLAKQKQGVQYCSEFHKPPAIDRQQKRPTLQAVGLIESFSALR